MNRHMPYNYSYPATTSAAASNTLTAGMPVAPSYTTTHHGTSSAFSENANPNEDWTKISDLAERRRIQNRIAQRNYRKKLKRRLADHERTAASKSASPELPHADIEPQNKMPQSPRTANMPSRKGRLSNASCSPSLKSPNLEQQNIYSPMPNDAGNDGSRGHVYTSYPSYPEVYNHPNVYASAQPLLHHPHPLEPYQTPSQSHHMDLSAPLRSQHPLDQLGRDPNSLYSSSLPPKHPNSFPEETALNPLCISYASITGLDMPASQYPQYNTQSQSPPLTNPSYSDGYSASTSPAGSLSEPYPLTPEPPCLSLDHMEYI